MYKLICIDLDGTLLDSKKRVSVTNKDAIKQALDEGVQVAIVSGRPNCFTIRIMQNIDDRMGHITFNGAYYRIADKSKTFPIADAVVKKVARLAKQENIRVYFKNKNTSLCTKEDPQILDYDMFKHTIPEKDRMDMYYNVDVEEYLQTHSMEVLKIFAWDENMQGKANVIHEVREESDVNLFVYDDYFELCSSSTDKGKAIVEVCKELGFKNNEVVCIGDNLNDMAMFEIAGLSIAMGNASDKIKESCDKVTLSNDENGVAHAIRNYVLEVNRDEKTNC